MNDTKHETPMTDAFAQELYQDDSCLLTEPEFDRMLAFGRELERDLKAARTQRDHWKVLADTRHRMLHEIADGGLANAYGKQAAQLKQLQRDLEAARRERDAAYEQMAKRMEELANAWGRNTPYACEKNDSYSLAAAECLALKSQPTPQAGEEYPLPPDDKKGPMPPDPKEGAERINTPCPACGFTSLFIANGGWLTCSRLECNDPTRVNRLIETASKFAPKEGE